MTSLKDYLPADLQPVVTVTESVEGVIGMTALNPINRMLQLAGVLPIEESQELAEADAAGTINQLVTVATNLPQYKGNAEAARFYTIGSLLSAISQNIQANPPQTTTGQSKSQELSVLAAMGADLIKTSQTMMKPQTASPAQASAQPATQAQS